MSPETHPTASRRLLLGAAAIAGLAGAGLALWRHQPSPVADHSPEIAAFWAAPLTDLTGQTRTPEAWHGKPLLVNFWATWCPPCVEELPLLNRFSQENQGKGLQVLAIAVDKREAVQRFWPSKGWTLPMLIADASGLSLSRGLGNDAGGLPFSVLFDAKSTLLAQKTGQLSAKDLMHWRSLALG